MQKLLFLVRHGEPTLKGTMLGRLDPPLSEEGLRLAEEKLTGLHAAIAWVSPLLRAQQTASFLPSFVERVTIPELAEVSLGEWEGKTWDQVHAGWPDLAQRKLANWFEVPAPGGEDWQAVVHRGETALERIRAGIFPAVVVAHHGINSVLRSLITGSDPHAHQQAYCEIFTHEL